MSDENQSLEGDARQFARAIDKARNEADIAKLRQLPDVEWWERTRFEIIYPVLNSAEAALLAKEIPADVQEEKGAARLLVGKGRAVTLTISLGDGAVRCVSSLHEKVAIIRREGAFISKNALVQAVEEFIQSVVGFLES